MPAGEELGVVAVLADETDGFGSGRGPLVVERGGNHLLPPADAAWIAFQTFSGDAGMGIDRTPRPERASTMALMTAGAAPIVPASPIPLTPSDRSSVMG